MPAGCNATRQTGEVTGWIVAGVDDSGLDVVFGDRHNRRRLGRDIDLAVVVGRGLIRRAALEVSHSRGDRIGYQRADILQNGHRLLAIDDVLDGGFLSILAGDVVVGDILVRREGIRNRARGAVIRGDDEHGALVGGRSGRQVRFRQVLGDREVPVRGDLADDLGHLIAGQRRLGSAGQPLRWSS